MARTLIKINLVSTNKIKLKIHELSESSLSDYLNVLEKWINEFTKVIPQYLVYKPIPVTWMEQSLITTPTYKWEIILLWDSYVNRHIITIKVCSNKHLHTIIINENKMYYCYDGKVQFVIKPIKSTLSTCLAYILYKVKELIEIVNTTLILGAYKNEKVIVGRYKVFVS